MKHDAGVAVWNSILGTDRSIGGTLSPPPSPVPLPAALPLFGSALAGLGGFGWLKRRGRFHARGARDFSARGH